MNETISDSTAKENAPEETSEISTTMLQASTAKNATADILAFAKKRPLWQQHALRRLATKTSLSEQDLTELLTAAKVEAGSIPVDPKIVLSALAEEHLTSTNNGQILIKLKSLGAIENANQLKPGETLDFGPANISLVYGDNGSGKSGYTRIFKSASAARGAEDILPDVFDATYNTKPPAKAIFKVITKQNGMSIESDVRWEDRKAPADVLRQIRVFDRKMAVLYVKDKTDIEFVPFNLDLLDRLGSLCVKLKELLKVELDKLDGERRAQLSTIPVGSVRIAAEGISHATAISDIEASCKWIGSDAERFLELLQLLDSAEKTVKALRVKKGRVDALYNRLDALEKTLSNQTATRITDLFKSRADLKAAAETARTAAFGKESKLLPGTGGVAWKALWEAARRYSVQIAYPGKLFPLTKTVDEKAAQCVLCQQDLTTEAQARLESFEKFVSGDLEKQAATSEKAYGDAIAVLNDVAVAISTEDQLNLSEIEADDANVATNLRSFFNQAQERKESLIEVGKLGDMTKLKPCPVSRLVELRGLSDGLARKISEAEAAMTTTRRQELEKERDALRTRKSLSEHKTALLALAGNRTTHKKLDNCNGQFDTLTISKEVSALNKKYINTQFEKCLAEELDAIGVRRKVTLQVGTQKASSFIKPRFDGSTFTELDRVLSEGEHRAVALACFLAETQMTGTKHTVVIDDPVSSLDHERRHLVAKRLVQESANRQVIIFTHDMVFWCEVVEAAEELKVPIVLKDLMRDGKVCGVVGQGIQPWHNLDVNLRLAHIQQLLPPLEALYIANSPEYPDKARSIAVKLRDVWERIVEESLFNKSLLRFRKSIQTRQLEQVKVELTDYEVIEKGMTRTSNWCHDRSRAQGNAAPTPRELKDEVAQIQTFHTALKDRRKEIEKQRKSQLKNLESLNEVK